MQNNFGIAIKDGSKAELLNDFITLNEIGISSYNKFMEGTITSNINGKTNLFNNVIKIKNSGKGTGGTIDGLSISKEKLRPEEIEQMLSDCELCQPILNFVVPKQNKPNDR